MICWDVKQVLSFRITIGVDDAGNHHERLHALLVPLLRLGAGPAVRLAAGLGHPTLALFPLPLAGLRQQLPQSGHLRHYQQGLPASV